MANEKKFLDVEGVKYLWSKVNMQDYPNNETLMAVINAIDETKADKESPELTGIPIAPTAEPNTNTTQIATTEFVNAAIEASTADWAQNDETAADYVKNKPVEETEDDALEMLAEMGIVDPVTDEEGSILTDENGNILTI